ncbi:MAG: hypothetical protein GTO30_22170, partial [Acidobacteria bacterium]|nr:hypothetical protein [Acidobacteriota bacterium]NIQ85126.1 hypothetical protein [Acidobacteriota bacterium]
HVGLKSNAAGSQAQALEYLDVSLDRHLKTSVFAVVGRSSTYDKLRKARAKFDIPSRTPAEVLGLL